MGIIEGLRDVHVIQLCLFNLTVDVYYVLGGHLFRINCISFNIILSPSPTKKISYDSEPLACQWVVQSQYI